MILFVYILKIATSLKTRRHCQMLKCTCECNIVSGWYNNISTPSIKNIRNLHMGENDKPSRVDKASNSSCNLHRTFMRKAKLCDNCHYCVHLAKQNRYIQILVKHFYFEIYMYSVYAFKIIYKICLMITFNVLEK